MSPRSVVHPGNGIKSVPLLAAWRYTHRLQLNNASIEDTMPDIRDDMPGSHGKIGQGFLGELPRSQPEMQKMVTWRYFAAQSASQLRQPFDKTPTLQTNDEGVEGDPATGRRYNAAAWARLEASVPGESGELVCGPDSSAAAGPEVPEHTHCPGKAGCATERLQEHLSGRGEALDETRVRKDAE